MKLVKKSKFQKKDMMKSKTFVSLSMMKLSRKIKKINNTNQGESIFLEWIHLFF